MRRLIARLLAPQLVAATYSCPYCRETFPDAISRSQHVRKCPDGPTPGRMNSSAAWLPEDQDRVLVRFLAGREQHEAMKAASAASWSGPVRESVSA